MASPILLPVPYHSDGDFWFARLCSLPGSVWLDSGRDRTSEGRYDILTALPREELTASVNGCRLRFRDGTSSDLPDTLLQCLQSRVRALGRNAVGEAPCPSPFCGGAIGFLGYESLHTGFGLPRPSDCEPTLPDGHFGLYDWALIQDHRRRLSFLCRLPDCPAEVVERVQDCLSAEPVLGAAFRCSELRPDTDEATYLRAVGRIKDYIRAGDTYQVNFSQRFSGPFSGSAAACYRQLRQILSGPFSAYVDTPHGSILSLSPERFLEARDGRVRTQPIKGTAPRGATPEEDTRLAEELQSSEKNRAENVMIVDLLRNDLSKVCQPFSVKVPELFGLQSFANVHHLVSTVTGQLKPDAGLFELIRATFPGGSITGAPKKRAMEIIAELEPHRRGVYCGSILYIGVDGRMDSNIAIRTLVQAQDQIYCWGGGGIVADSDPVLEYQESLHKVGILLRGLKS